MSWWVSLSDADGNHVEVETFVDGGTYQVNGSPVAELNVTYNYSKFYYLYLNQEEGLKWLHGKEAKDTIKALEQAVSKMTGEPSQDYWDSCEGNARIPLVRFLGWAKQYPEAKWVIH